MLTTIHPLCQEDIPTVAAIAQDITEYPWSEAVFADCLKADYKGWVLGEGETFYSDGILGFIITLLQMDEMQLLNIGVRLAHQRHGYGKQLLRYAIEVAEQMGMHRITLEVRASNAAAIALYHDLGFHDIGVRRHYYATESGREDALILLREIAR